MAAAEFESALARSTPNTARRRFMPDAPTTPSTKTRSRSSYFKEAISIDPDYLEARSSYAGALLDAGDMDEAIRQLNVVTQRDPRAAWRFTCFRRRLRARAIIDDAIQAARQAIVLTPGNAEAHFWLAESLRQKNVCGEAESQYNDYLSLSNFDSGMAGKLNYYLGGYLLGYGVKKRAAQTDIWKELRGQANTGLCDCEFLQKKLDSAIRYCQTALTFTPTDLFTNYRLGVLYSEQYNQSGSVALLAAARKHFENVIEQNPDANEADRSRKYVKNIDAVLAQHSPPLSSMKRRLPDRLIVAIIVALGLTVLVSVLELACVWRPDELDLRLPRQPRWLCAPVAGHCLCRLRRCHVCKDQQVSNSALDGRRRH
jgi:tetratricopeptide (TPR) repeat protein